MARQRLLRLIHRVSVSEVRVPRARLLPVSIYYKYGNSFIGTMTETNRYVKAYREGKVPFVVNQSIWFEGETKFADIILPACTNFERWDIGEWASAAELELMASISPTTASSCLRRSASSRSANRSPTTRSSRLLAERLGLGPMLHRRLRRPRLGQTHVRGERPAHPYLLGRVRQGRATTWCRHRRTESRLRP